MRYIWYGLSILFVAAAGVQFNDTDAVVMWIALYLGAATVAGFWATRDSLSARGKVMVLLGAFAVEIGAVLWAILHVRAVLAVGEIDFGSKVQRDFGGLVIVAIAMSVAISSARGKKLAKK